MRRPDTIARGRCGNERQWEANAMKKSVLMVTIFLILFAPGRAAAQLKLFVGGAVTEPVNRVDAEFAKKSGHRARTWPGCSRRWGSRRKCRRRPYSGIRVLRSRMRLRRERRNSALPLPVR